MRFFAQEQHQLRREHEDQPVSFCCKPSGPQKKPRKHPLILSGTNISPTNWNVWVHDFPFPRWDMLVPWRVISMVHLRVSSPLLVNYPSSSFYPWMIHPYPTVTHWVKSFWVILHERFLKHYSLQSARDLWPPSPLVKEILSPHECSVCCLHLFNVETCRNFGPYGSCQLRTPPKLLRKDNSPWEDCRSNKMV